MTGVSQNRILNLARIEDFFLPFLEATIDHAARIVLSFSWLTVFIQSLPSRLLIYPPMNAGVCSDAEGLIFVA